MCQRVLAMPLVVRRCRQVCVRRSSRQGQLLQSRARRGRSGVNEREVNAKVGHRGRERRRRTRRRRRRKRRGNGEGKGEVCPGGGKEKRIGRRRGIEGRGRGEGGE